MCVKLCIPEPMAENIFKITLPPSITNSLNNESEKLLPRMDSENGYLPSREYPCYTGCSCEKGCPMFCNPDFVGVCCLSCLCPACGAACIEARSNVLKNSNVAGSENYWWEFVDNRTYTGFSTFKKPSCLAFPFCNFVYNAVERKAKGGPTCSLCINSFFCWPCVAGDLYTNLPLAPRKKSFIEEYFKHFTIFSICLYGE